MHRQPLRTLKGSFFFSHVFEHYAFYRGAEKGTQKLPAAPPVSGTVRGTVPRLGTGLCRSHLRVCRSSQNSKDRNEGQLGKRRDPYVWVAALTLGEF